MSDEENVRGFMDFINNISPIDDTEKKEEKENEKNKRAEYVVKKKNENIKSYISKSNDSLENSISTSKNIKKKEEKKVIENKDNEIMLEKENALPSFQKTNEEVEDILKNIGEIKQFFNELKLNARRDIESYTDEILSGASQQSKVLFDLMDKVLVSWQNYHAEILNKSKIKDLVENKEKKNNSFIL